MSSNWLETQIVNHFFRNQSVTSPASLYLALFTVAPDDSGAGGTEVTGGSYARQLITFGADTDGVSHNTAAIDFAGMPSCTVIYGGVFTAVSGGNFMGGNNFTMPRVVPAGAVFTVPIGDVILVVT